MNDSGGRTPPRRFAVALAAIPLLAVTVADVTLIARHHTGGSHPAATAPTHPRPSSTARADAVRNATASRTAAIREVLARRSDAVVHHDRAEWASVLDPRHKVFRRRQLAVFANLRHVPFASWSYSFDPTVAQPRTATLRRYDAAVWAPRHFTLRYRLAGFDPRPTSLLQYPTFVRRGDSWYLTSLSDFASAHQRSSLDLWDFGPVSVVHTPDVLVLGHPGDPVTLREVATDVTADIPRVAAVWRHRWLHRVVVLVPDTQRELGRVVGDAGDLDHIAAVATAEVQIGTGRPNPVGDRIGINPQNWPKLSPLGRQIVLTHELTHIATRAITSNATPTWLAEGFADYVGYLDSGVPTTFVAQDLAADVRAGHPPASLPPERQFAGASSRLSQAYEGAWMACRLIADRWGQPALVHFYLAVSRSRAAPAVSVAGALRRLFHLTPRAFVTQWHSYLRAQLG